MSLGPWIGGDETEVYGPDEDGHFWLENVSMSWCHCVTEVDLRILANDLAGYFGWHVSDTRPSDRSPDDL